jgi:hypothetical protein
MTCTGMHVLTGGTTPPDSAGAGMAPPMHRPVGKQGWVGMACQLLGPCRPELASLLLTCVSCPHRQLPENNLSGTLPKEWSALTSLTLL